MRNRAHRFTALHMAASRAVLRYNSSEVRDRREIESSIDVFAREPNGGLIVPPDAITSVPPD